MLSPFLPCARYTEFSERKFGGSAGASRRRLRQCWCIRENGADRRAACLACCFPRNSCERKNVFERDLAFFTNTRSRLVVFGSDDLVLTWTGVAERLERISKPFRFSSVNTFFVLIIGTHDYSDCGALQLARSHAVFVIAKHFAISSESVQLAAFGFRLVWR